MSAYETFRPADVPWINMIPTHWETKRLKELLAERKESNNPVKTTDILSLTNTRGVIPYAQKGNIGNKSKENLENYKLAYPNDLVLNSMNVIIGSVGLSQYFGAVSPVYYMLYPRKNDNIRYFEYIFKLKTIQEYLKGLGNGILAIRMRIPMIKLNNVLLPVPPREEQDQIVRYLDWQTSKINKLIATKKKKITLLNEQKQVIINNAVTKGLDPMAQMKDSGIEWIGTIPQEWSISRLKTQVSLATSKKVRNDELYIGMENIQSWTGMYVCATSVDSEGICNVFENNNILFGKLRPYLAKVYLTNSNGVCSSEFLVIRSFSGCMKYLFYVLLSYKFIDLVNSSTYGAKMPRANWSFIGNCSIPVPPLKEQIKIVLYLDERCNAIENIKSNIQNEVKLLYEYRTRLISDVVTGQIDVRDIEIPEYEYAEEESNEESDEMEGADEEAEEQEE